jgi:thiol-disulfide isomerase/thioredoxin
VSEIDLEGLKKLLRRDPKQPRPLLVNFWATWCEPCRDEFPDLVRIDADYKARGFEFITVSLDEPGEIGRGVPQFLREMQARMPAYLLNVDDPEPAIKEVDPTWGGALPATFLYDARGQVVYKHMGRVRAAELRAAIEKVMSEK